MLIIDKILSVARYGGEARFVDRKDWAFDFVRYAALVEGATRFASTCRVSASATEFPSGAGGRLRQILPFSRFSLVICSAWLPAKTAVITAKLFWYCVCAPKSAAQLLPVLPGVFRRRVRLWQNPVCCRCSCLRCRGRALADAAPRIPAVLSALATTLSAADAAVATGLTKKRLSVIWLHFQECTGCTESMLRAEHPTLES